MAMEDLAELKAKLAPGARLMGLDVGAKTIGLALSDASHIVATPFDTIRRGKFAADAARLKDIVAAENVGGLVIGLPVNMDGSEGPRCQSVRQFGRNLLDAGVDLPLAFWDERLSTAAVERVMIEEVDMSRKRRAQVVDKAAAAWILQGALEALRKI